ncbi:hypothetical protein Bca4012_041055 [Brassica carinata]
MTSASELRSLTVSKRVRNSESSSQPSPMLLQWPAGFELYWGRSSLKTTGPYSLGFSLHTPVVVSILDGSTLKLILEDEDDFAMLAENLFTDLDEEDKGKLPKRQIRKALSLMGAEMGVPPLSDFPILENIIKKHDADGDEELGQAQFAELLQPILQEIADVLHEKPITIVQNVEIFNGSKLRKILADEKTLKCLVEKMVKDNQGRADLIKNLMIENGKELGLPPLSSENESVALLYETIQSQLTKRDKETSEASAEEEFMDALQDILGRFAELLESTPVYSATTL